MRRKPLVRRAALAFLAAGSCIATACAAELRAPIVAEEIGRRPQGVYLVLSRAAWCSVTCAPGTRIVSYAEASRAACRLTPFKATLDVHLRESLAAPPVWIGRVEVSMGRVRLATSDLVAMAKRQRELPWSSAGVLELVGADGRPVARIDLEPLRARLADGHAAAIAKGRGDARLGAADLTGHPSASRLREAAVRGTAARRGERTPPW
jgi:hypothetical protein